MLLFFCPMMIFVPQFSAFLFSVLHFVCTYYHTYNVSRYIGGKTHAYVIGVCLIETQAAIRCKKIEISSFCCHQQKNQNVFFSSVVVVVVCDFDSRNRYRCPLFYVQYVFVSTVFSTLQIIFFAYCLYESSFSLCLCYPSRLANSFSFRQFSFKSVLPLNHLLLI